MAAYSRSFMDEDEELETLETENLLESPQELDKEETTWKKRYGDLRRSTQKQSDDIKALRAQVEQSARSNFNMPNADDEAALNEWIVTYPDIARVVTTLASKQAKEQMRAVDDRVKQFEADKERDAKETAIRKLTDAHPDFFNEIRIDPKFEEWILSKSKRMQDALYSDESVTDWQSASDVISMYKTEMGISKAKTPRRDTNREVVKDVPTRQTTRPTNNADYRYTESQIKSMKPWEYDKNEADIEDAMRTGKVLMDITAGAR